MQVRLWLRAAGVTSVVGAVAFVPFIAVSTHASSLVLLPIVLWAVGPVTMIIHLNVSRSMSDEEKAVWRRRLWWNTALAPIEYLLTRPGGPR